MMKFCINQPRKQKKLPLYLEAILLVCLTIIVYLIM